MISLWKVLIVLSVVEAALVLWLLPLVWRARRLGPVGLRLLVVAIVFLLQSVASLWAYSKWMASGYGREVAGPLLLLHALIIVGVASIADIVRR